MQGAWYITAPGPNFLTFYFGTFRVYKTFPYIMAFDNYSSLEKHVYLYFFCR